MDRNKRADSQAAPALKAGVGQLVEALAASTSNICDFASDDHAICASATPVGHSCTLTLKTMTAEVVG